MNFGKNKEKVLGARLNNYFNRYLAYVLSLNQETLWYALWEVGHNTIILEQCEGLRTRTKD